MAGELDALKAEVVEFRREVAETAASAAKAIGRIQELLDQIAAGGDATAISDATAALAIERTNLDNIQQSLESAGTPPTP